MSDRDPHHELSKSVPAIETRRILLGFMTETAAIRKLQSARTVGNPVDTLNRSVTDDESLDTEARYTELWEKAKNAIDDPNQFKSSAVELKDIPNESGVEDYLHTFTNTPHFREAIENRPADRWNFKLVPIDNLVSFQPSVTKTAYRDDIPSATDSLIELLRFALPVDTAPLVEDQPIQDSYFQGWQFVTRSPNIRIEGPFQSRPDMDNTVFATVSFELKYNPNFVYVTHFDDRYILKNGYHRTYQLLRAGETHVPAMVLDAQTYSDTGGAESHFLDREIVMGDRPPMLSDYDTPIAIDIERRAKNRVIRVIAETTDVLR